MVSLKKIDGSEPSFSSLSGHRAGLNHLLREFGVSMSQEKKDEISSHFRGIKRKKTLEAQAGKGTIKTGKDPQDFSLYVWFCSKFLSSTDSAEGIFAWCALTLSWNLMCRVRNSMSICFELFIANQDSIGILFAHMKK